ncbi:TPA: class C sortase, partial [Streptococcus agalactiae]
EGHLNTIYRYLFYISLVIIAWLLWLIKRQRQKNRLASVRKGIES